MSNWFECKVRYEKTMENGMQKKVTEPYLVDALSFTEAEARIIKEMIPFISGEFTVSDIKRAKYAELFENPDGDKWYKCKVLFITIDEKSAAEKKTASNMLVQAPDIQTALTNLTEGMKGTMADYEVASITETTIMDIYHYVAEEPEFNRTSPVNSDDQKINMM
ncbi:MAG: DUF4494 domain-containing protein [Candidatus Azobacteroides sp.]|nr:DUF4494 domain-containing protein [Candidatus Azobacteroides sp.]